MSLENLMREFPEEQEALLRLQNKFEEMRKTGRSEEWTIKCIYNLMQPSSKWVLLPILSRLRKQGIISERIRVYSPEGEVIQDYTATLDIPPVVENWRNGESFIVGINNLRMIYIYVAQPLTDGDCREGVE